MTSPEVIKLLNLADATPHPSNKYAMIVNWDQESVNEFCRIFGVCAHGNGDSHCITNLNTNMHLKIFSFITYKNVMRFQNTFLYQKKFTCQ